MLSADDHWEFGVVLYGLSSWIPGILGLHVTLCWLLARVIVKPSISGFHHFSPCELVLRRRGQRPAPRGLALGHMTSCDLAKGERTQDRGD
jgi:hypothetical protein